MKYESANDDADHLECGKCGQVCLSINLFIAHKKECVTNRKRRRGNEQDESKGDIKSAPKSKQRKTVRISKEEENFLRISVLIMRVATAAVRIAFNKEFHGDALQRTLFEDPKVLVSLKRERIISQFDLQQIFRRSGLASSYSFSLKFMIWLIQYRTPSDVSRGLQDDPKHISIHAGLSRILKYKNKIARMIDPKLQEDKLEEYWTDISKAIVRLGGEGFLQKCNDLKVSILNENYIDMLTEIIEIAKSNDSNQQGFKRFLDNLFYIMPKTVSPRTTPESNYIGIADLLLKNGPPAVRIIFDREFHPDVLQKELRKRTARLAHLKGRGLINPAQWNKLFTRKDKNKSKTFDLSLMICLIRNFTTIDVTYQLPRPEDKCEGADLSRLEYYRKQIAYSQECDLSVTVFEKYLTDITNAIIRIGGTMFLQRCEDLKMGKLDQKDKAILPEPNSSNIPN
ncbi:uncharacterized protein LOC127718436 isoform X2 [Mytilus californianus]|uniref:uncharacterized protein LOC127718436 isoform X2 n=1 Tax=Mytilus californianus TaxID=6549 RepID=UPI0022458F60|nr:uncharacterized protein LOC127718436 isoform X2 [Mytilus californianus]